MNHHRSRLNAPLRLGIAAVVAVAWMLGVIACCPVSQPAASAAAVAGVGHGLAGHAQHGVGGHAQHGDTGAARTGVISRACPHHCADMSTPAMHAGQVVDLLAPTVAATAVLAAPFAGPVVAGTRAPPVPIEAVHDHLGRNILTRICICRR